VIAPEEAFMSMRALFRSALFLVPALAVSLTAGAQQPSPAKPAPKPAAKPAAKTVAPAKAAPAKAPAGPVILFETPKGEFSIELFPDDAPKSVEHILRLVQRNFYNGQRVHRVEPGFVVQFGDPKSRDMTKRDSWGQTSGGGSGRPVGVAEISKTHLHLKGAVGMAHAGDATQADSQIYIMLGDRPSLNGKYAVIGQVVSGMDVVQKLAVEDRIMKAYVKK
jgi:cyclophilin family peptidyl-prolyl cis-trans isomerase